MSNFTSNRDPLQVPVRETRATYPDIGFIKKFIPVRDIALELGLDVIGHSARCWRPDNHQNGDRTPSVSFNKRKNVGRCFVCDDRAWSGIDLVQMVMDYSTREAIEWIASRFPVPQISKHKHLKTREHWDAFSRVGTSGFILEEIVRTGFWSVLSSAQARILVVLCTFCVPRSSYTPISYRGIMRYAGIGSQSTVSRVLRGFARMGLLEIRRSLDGQGFRDCNSYSLTLENPRFLELVRDCYHRHREEIELERQFRAEQRKDRRAQRHYTGNTSVQPV